MSSGFDDWALRAKCKGSADDLFVTGAAQRSARRICADCAVRVQCLAEALDNRVEWGVWGGMTERERRRLLKLRSDVSSWASLLLREDEPDTA